MFPYNSPFHANVLLVVGSQLSHEPRIVHHWSSSREQIDDHRMITLRDPTLGLGQKGPRFLPILFLSCSFIPRFLCAWQMLCLCLKCSSPKSHSLIEPQLKNQPFWKSSSSTRLTQKTPSLFSYKQPELTSIIILSTIQFCHLCFI